MVSRRSLLRAGMVAPLAMAGTAFTGNALAASASAAASSGAAAKTAAAAGAAAKARAATGAGPNLVGYTVSGTLSCTELDRLTGRTARVVRSYHKKGTPVPAELPARLLRCLNDGRRLVYSLKIPDTSAATYAACEALAARIAADGHAGKVWMVLWHEPYPELSAAAFIERYRAIAPAIRSNGIACGACFHTYPIWRKGVDYSEYWPGDDLTDFLAIDTYPSDTHDGLAADPLTTIAPLTSLARSRGKVFGIGEFAVQAPDAADDPQAALAWVRNFDRLGDDCQFTIYWNGAVDQEMGMEQNGGLLVPAYRHLYDSFTRAGG